MDIHVHAPSQGFKSYTVHVSIRTSQTLRPHSSIRFRKLDFIIDVPSLAEGTTSVLVDAAFRPPADRDDRRHRLLSPPCSCVVGGARPVCVHALALQQMCMCGCVQRVPRGHSRLIWRQIDSSSSGHQPRLHLALGRSQPSRCQERRPGVGESRAAQSSRISGGAPQLPKVRTPCVCVLWCGRPAPVSARFLRHFLRPRRGGSWHRGVVQPRAHIARACPGGGGPRRCGCRGSPHVPPVIARAQCCCLYDMTFYYFNHGYTARGSRLRGG